MKVGFCQGRLIAVGTPGLPYSMDPIYSNTLMKDFSHHMSRYYLSLPHYHTTPFTIVGSVKSGLFSISLFFDYLNGGKVSGGKCHLPM